MEVAEAEDGARCLRTKGCDGLEGGSMWLCFRAFVCLTISKHKTA